MGRWASAAGIWFLTVIITGKSLHLVNVLTEPEAVSGTQYGMVLFVSMGTGWLVGWIPALVALRLSRRKPGFERVALLAAFLYDLSVFALVVAAEALVLHRAFEWSTPLNYLLALFPSIMATAFALLDPAGIGFGLLALVPLLGLEWLLYQQWQPSS